LFASRRTSEHHGAGEVSAVAGVSGAHHVLGLEGLVGQLSARHGPVLLGPAGGLKEGGEGGREEGREGGRGEHDGGREEGKEEGEGGRKGGRKGLTKGAKPIM